jgi:hypothetical protein
MEQLLRSSQQLQAMLNQPILPYNLAQILLALQKKSVRKVTG